MGYATKEELTALAESVEEVNQIMYQSLKKWDTTKKRKRRWQNKKN